MLIFANWKAEKKSSFQKVIVLVHMVNYNAGQRKHNVNVIPIKKLKGSDFGHLNSHQSFEERTRLYSGPSTCVSVLASCIEGFLNASRGLSLNSDEMIESS